MLRQKPQNLTREYLFLYLNSGGSILIIATWVLVFFTILSVGLYKIVSSQVRLVKTLEERLICPYLAKSACNHALLDRKKDETLYDTLYELRRERVKQLARGEFIYTLIDEASRININTAPVEVIARLPGLNLELAQGIRASEFRPFSLKEELLLGEDISAEVFDGCKDFITVYNDGRVNINTAPAAVLKALGLNDNLVEIIRAFRAGPDNKEATGDDGIFEDTDEIIVELQEYAGISGPQITSLLNLIGQGLISVTSKTLSLEIETKILDRKAGRFMVVLDGEKIRQWTEW